MSEQAKKTVEALGVMTVLCIGLLFYRAVSSDSLRYFFIPENLFLAWSGLGFSWILVQRLKTNSWLDKKSLALTALWLFFLPNTWYVLTDFVHMPANGEVNQLFDICLLSSFTITGLLLGFLSLFLVHKELLKRTDGSRSYSLIELIILVSSFAIYLGRVLRWNSWDVLTNPGGLILNVSDRIIDPLSHMDAMHFTSLFFVVLSVSYFAFYRFASDIATSKRDA